MKSRLSVCMLVLLLLVGACRTDEETTTTTDTEAPVGLFASALVEFDSCESFLAGIKAEALERVGPWGLLGDGPVFPADAVMEMQEAEMAMDDGAGAESGPTGATPGVDYSTTNVQEMGVDEPDIVKTDGRRILALNSGVLNYIDLTSGQPQVVSTLELPTWQGWELWDHQLFLRGDTALVLASGSSEDGRSASVVIEIDVSDPADLPVRNTLATDGYLVSARLVGDRVALVVTSAPPIIRHFVFPGSASDSAEARALAANREIVETSSLEDWLPQYELTATGGASTTGSLVDCSSGYLPQEFSGFETLSVVTFDLAGGIGVEEVATIMSGGDTVYSSTEQLYVASHRWIDWDPVEADELEGMQTHIHRFDISAPGGPVYEASGSVNGFLLNQFAMSEYDGYLRVASTNLPDWWWREGTSESRVDVLERDGRDLRVVGSVGGLGRGERIFAVRFLGEVGYVVTFRQVDPLYTIDLSEPSSPRVMGELKILGYSAYLHPIADGLLLGIGQDADEEGWITGTQVSLFDVSDLANPVRTHQLTFPQVSGSEVEYDHHAFLYWPPEDLAVLPVGWWGSDEEDDEWRSNSTAWVLEVGHDGIAERGRIQHPAPDPEGDEDYFLFVETADIRRSLVIGDTLFTLSEAGLKGSDIGTLRETSWTPLEGAFHRMEWYR